jgi:hypothetical protein
MGSMTETEQFMAAIGPRITEAETALHNGDSGPRSAMWSRAEPLTLFGAAISGRGWGEIGPIFDTLGHQFSGCLSYQNQIVAAEASGDLATPSRSSTRRRRSTAPSLGRMCCA